MIVQPDFPEHYKTHKLIAITNDPSAPLAVIRFWGYCHTSRRWEFPDMTPSQLDAICRWGERKPACHVALIKAGFVDRIEPKGFAAHDWQEYNRQLIQKWEAGKKGGRPPKEETDRFQPVSRTATDRPDKTRPDRKILAAPSGALPQQNANTDNGQEAGADIHSLVGGLVKRVSVRIANAPSLEAVKAEMESQFKGASQYAESFHRKKTEDGWRDQNGQPINHWKPMARSWASACEKRKRGVTQR